ncbi:MAG: cation transporter [Bacilli bacterium]|nr:cation transporter [Bacilli bacterium]
MKQITFKIDGMHCSMCEAHVADAIRRSLPKAKSVKASHHKGHATFQIEDGVDYSPAIEQLSNAGYRVLSTEEGQPQGLLSKLFGGKKQ